jgi:outer membrane protein OmpA-like peptidoglycan-associated protein
LRIGAAAKFPIKKSAPVYPEKHYQRDTAIEYKIGITAPEIVLISSKKTMQGIDTLITEHYVKYLPKKADLNANLSYYVLESGQKKSVPSITIEEFETTEYFPFLPIVFFPDGSSDLNLTKMRQISAAQTSHFKEESLKDRNIMVLYRDMLNILGERMKKHPRSNITITGFSSEVGKDAQNRNIWSERAEVIKKYLVDA